MSKWVADCNFILDWPFSCSTAAAISLPTWRSDNWLKSNNGHLNVTCNKKTKNFQYVDTAIFDVSHTPTEYVANRVSSSKKCVITPMTHQKVSCESHLRKYLSQEMKTCAIHYMWSQLLSCACTYTCVVMDFNRLSLYCPYPMAFQWASRRE